MASVPLDPSATQIPATHRQRRCGVAPTVLLACWALTTASACADGTKPVPGRSTPSTDDDASATRPTSTADAGPRGDSAIPDDTATPDTAADSSVAPTACDPASVRFEPAVPTPVISEGRPVVASTGVDSPEALVDGRFGSSGRTDFGTPSSSDPQWVSLDLGTGPEQLLVVLHSTGANYHQANSDAPEQYTLLVSADSTDGEDGTWNEVVTVDDNTVVRSRSHLVDFTGDRWLRISVSKARDQSHARLDELVVSDLSNVTDERIDSWFFFGDSITQAAFNRTGTNVDMFDGQVHALDDRFTPTFINGGIGGELVPDALDRLQEAVDLNPGFRQFAIAFGTNDAWGNKTPTSFEKGLRELLDALIAADKVPLLARIPYVDGTTHDTLPEFNAVIDELQVEYGLPCGPDLYTWFKDHPEQLGSDGVHPRDAGNDALNLLWAQAAIEFEALESKE